MMRAEDSQEDRRFSFLCQAGETADRLGGQGDQRAAIAGYSAILRQMQTDGRIDAYVAAKATLGTMLALVRDGAIAQAYAVWTSASDDSIYGIGVQVIETGHTSVDDLMLYFRLSAWLHAHAERPPAESRGAVDDLMARVWDHSQAECRRRLPDVAGMWAAAYAVIGGGVLNDRWSADLTTYTQGIWAGNAAAVRTDFPEPSGWRIDWEGEATAAGGGTTGGRQCLS